MYLGKMAAWFEDQELATPTDKKDNSIKNMAQEKAAVHLFMIICGKSILVLFGINSVHYFSNILVEVHHIRLHWGSFPPPSTHHLQTKTNKL